MWGGVLPYLGKISFSIYLSNFSIEVALYMLELKFNFMLPANGWFFVIYIAIHIVVGSIVYYLVEVKLTGFIVKKMNTVKILKN